MERPQDLPNATAASPLLEALVEAYAALGHWLWRGIGPDPRHPRAHAD